MMVPSSAGDAAYEFLMQIVQERRSIRRFKPGIPEKERIMQMLEAARFAPSATNLQPWKFFVITNPDIKDRMEKAVSEKIDSLDASRLARTMGNAEAVKTFGREYFLFFRKAPAVIATFFKPYPVSASLGYESGPESEEKMRMLGIESASAAVQNMLLAAHSLGLGACWLDGPLIAREELEELLNVAEPWRLMCLVAVGYPADVPPPVRRKKLALISRFIE